MTHWKTFFPNLFDGPFVSVCVCVCFFFFVFVFV